MRLWSLHPRHLDRPGLLACWRESLLAQAVLAERTRGYRNHPQLERFRAQPEPLASVGAYLAGLAAEADRRGYRFDRGRVLVPDAVAPPIPLTAGQLDLEWAHLGRKLQQRSPESARAWAGSAPRPHPLFRVVPGDVESWERAAPR